MSISAIIGELSEIVIPLENIFLDPNNPRFVDSKWVNIPDDEITKPEVQENARRRLIEGFGIEKLQLNMEVNGYLPIDRVILRKLKDKQYVVLEGNRRICAAKLIQSIGLDGSAISEEVKNSLKSIPCVLYSGSDGNASWIFQGLRHISGINDWSAYNKARLLVEQMDEEGMSLTDVGKRFGLSRYGAGQWARGYYSYKQAREESDFVLVVDERSYPYFQELFNRSSALVREWMEWDDLKNKFKNLMNFNEFVSWLYPKQIGDEEEDTNTEAQGDWERRWLGRRDDIRRVSFLIKEAPDVFQEFRSTGDLERLYSQAVLKKYEKQAKEEADPIQEAFDSLAQCIKALENIPLRATREEALKTKLNEYIVELEKKIKYIRS